MKVEKHDKAKQNKAEDEKEVAEVMAGAKGFHY